MIIFTIPTTAIADAPSLPTIINTNNPVNVMEENVAIDGMANFKMCLTSCIGSLCPSQSLIIDGIQAKSILRLLDQRILYPIAERLTPRFLSYGPFLHNGEPRPPAPEDNGDR